ncbi:DUF29 family protein [Anaerolineales bacterium HSG24]|nr:DUF29 family protein [Anaerolineales bacterium HSG24]
MEELLELRGYIERQEYPEALSLLEEMEEMSRQDKINKIYSFVKVLLLHLIKQDAEKRTTRSWDYSIRNALNSIFRTNQMRKTKGCYLSEEGLKETIHQAYALALAKASLEAFEGQYDEKQLGDMVDRPQIEQKAFDLING